MKYRPILEPVQRRATMLVKAAKDKTHEEHLQIPSLKYRRRRADMFQILKIVSGLIRMESLSGSPNVCKSKMLFIKNYNRLECVALTDDLVNPSILLELFANKLDIH